MWTTDLLTLFMYMSEMFPQVLIDHVDSNGIVHCTSFHKVDLFMFKARHDKMEYLAEIFNADPT